MRPCRLFLRVTWVSLRLPFGNFIVIAAGTSKRVRLYISPRRFRRCHNWSFVSARSSECHNRPWKVSRSKRQLSKSLFIFIPRAGWFYSIPAQIHIGLGNIKRNLRHLQCAGRRPAQNCRPWCNLEHHWLRLESTDEKEKKGWGEIACHSIFQDRLDLDWKYDAAVLRY